MTTKLNTFHTKLETIYRNDTLNKVLRECQEDGATNCIQTADFIDYYKYGTNDKITNIDLSGVSYYTDGSDNIYTTGNIYTKLVGDAGTYSTVDEFAQDLVDISNALISTDFSDYHPDQMSKYKSMKQKRKDLDNKMRELYANEYTDNQLMYDSSVYVNLAWTVLATSVLYYLFVKL